MITEDYVSFEVAKLLKEKGFYQDFLNEITPVWKLNGNNEELAFYGADNYPCECEEWYSAPSLQMACKWLREVHNTFICINMVGNGDDSYVLFTYNVYQNKNYKLMFGSNIPKYNSYEEAVEAAIKYTLENLL